MQIGCSELTSPRFSVAPPYKLRKNISNLARMSSMHKISDSNSITPLSTVQNTGSVVK
jgi:hypothetical protein